MYFAGREKKRGINLLMPDVVSGEDQEEGETQSLVPQEVLVISLGIANECPGMLAEQKVLNSCAIPVFDPNTNKQNIILSSVVGCKSMKGLLEFCIKY